MTRSPILVLLFVFVSCQKEVKPISSKAIKNNTEKGALAAKLADLGDSAYTVKKFDSAYYYYNKSKELFEIEKDSSYVAYTLIQLARIQQTFGDYSSSEETLTEALPYIENNLHYQIGTNNLLGIAAKELKNFDDAVSYYDKALAATKDPLMRLTPLNNSATVYIEQKKYSKAIVLLEPLLKSNLEDTLPLKKALIMDNLGFAYSKNNNPTKGIALMNQSLAMRSDLDDSYGSIESHLHLADFYRDSNFSKSKEHALQAYRLATEYNSINERLEALAYLMSYSEKRGKNKYAHQFVRLNDSIKKVQNNAKNQFAKIRYDSRKATLENIQFKAQRTTTLLQVERQKNQKYISFYALLALLATILYAISYYRRKNKRERLAASYAAEIRISKALHDELANDVFYAMNFAETQDLQHPMKKETLLQHLDKIYSRTRNFSKENSPIETGADFEANLKQMLNSYKSNGTEIIIKNGSPIDWSTVPTEKKIALYRVVQELMVNMKKHSQARFVVIGFDKEQHTIKIDYSDNGVGFSEKLTLKNGLQNAENRIHAVNGQLTFESETNKGFKAKIVLPK
jgi:signal transduction histidine kinase